MTTQHTPGPWSVEIDHHNNVPEFIRVYADGEMYDLASVLCDETGNATANARLISAAPDLLAAIEGLLNALPSATTHPAIKAARAAIAKATGEAA